MPAHLWKELAMHLRNTGSVLTLEQAATVAIRAWIAANQPRASMPAVTPQPLHETALRAASSASAQSGASLHDEPADNFPGPEGYQWKSLFLPSGTDLRMATRDGGGHARVCGDNIIYEGRKVSPRGLTLAIAGEGRNAWRDLWLRMPGEIDFKPASRHRLEHARMSAGLPLHPYPQHARDMINQRRRSTDAQAQPEATSNATGKSSDPTRRAEKRSAFRQASSAAKGPKPRHKPPSARDETSNTASPVLSHMPSAAAAISEALKAMLTLIQSLPAQTLSAAMPDDEERRINPARRAEDILADAYACD